MQGVEYVLLDIEGTVCSISFVKDVLFPYAINALPDVLAEKWDAPEFQPFRNAFPEEYQKDPDTLRAHVEDLTKRDVKIAYLKNLQGFLWEEGYKTGAYATSLFPDVVPALQQWKDNGYSLAIYSSGSVFAQKLLFAHVQTATASKKRRRLTDDTIGQAAEGASSPPQKKLATNGGEAVVPGSGRDSGSAPENNRGVAGDVSTTTSIDAGKAAKQSGTDGPTNGNEDETRTSPVADLTEMFTGWFDTTNAGLKTTASSYTKIAQELECKAESILFLSDNVKEVDAAIDAGMKSVVVDRPGNARLSDDDKERLQVVESLSQIKLPTGKDVQQ